MGNTYSVRPGKEYRHFKGKHYVVLYVGKDANTTEDVVVYRSQHGDFQVWVRPLRDFTAFVDRNGYRGPRFMEIKHDRKVSRIEMVVWHSMDLDPPGPGEIGRRLLLSVQPRYGPAYTDAMIWFGPIGRAWPKITHWAHMPRPCTEGVSHEESF